MQRLEDPRDDNGRRDLREILMIAHCPMPCGAGDCSAMAPFGQTKEPFAPVASAMPRHSQPRHLRPCVPPARPRAVPRLLPAFHAGNVLIVALFAGLGEPGLRLPAYIETWYRVLDALGIQHKGYS
jgi:hypothetical protein